MLSRLIRYAAVSFVIVAVVFGARSALAGSAMLKRSLSNIVQSPLELVTAPVAAAVTVKKNMELDDYSTAAKVVLGVPFVIFMGIPHISFVGGRAVAGVLELPISLPFLFMKRDPKPFFDLLKQPALVDHETAYFHFKFGHYIATR